MRPVYAWSTHVYTSDTGVCEVAGHANCADQYIGLGSGGYPALCSKQFSTVMTSLPLLAYDGPNNETSEMSVSRASSPRCEVVSIVQIARYKAIASGAVHQFDEKAGASYLIECGDSARCSCHFCQRSKIILGVHVHCWIGFRDWRLGAVCEVTVSSAPLHIVTDGHGSHSAWGDFARDCTVYNCFEGKNV